MVDQQTEEAFQKQFGINRKVKPGVVKKKFLRRHRDIGLGFKTPRKAIDGSYIDKKCPFTRNVSICGRILTGAVHKTKMQSPHRNMSVHCSLCFRDVEIGDIVTIGECRPLSKIVRFNVLKVSKGQGSKKNFKMF
uniref:Small ribosomal subunit protein uS17 n=1 Tax=Stomoxys calcitrans TaxID=35570 RepID=A0A1I8P6W9_STOCA